MSPHSIILPRLVTSASTRTLTQALYCHHTAPFCCGCWPQLRPGHGPRVCSVTTQHHYVEFDDLSFDQDIATGFLVSPHSTSVSRLLTSALTRTWLQTLQCHHTVPLWLAGDISFDQDMAQGFLVLPCSTTVSRLLISVSTRTWPHAFYVYQTLPIYRGLWPQLLPGHGPSLSMVTNHYILYWSFWPQLQPGHGSRIPKVMILTLISTKILFQTYNPSKDILTIFFINV